MLLLDLLLQDAEAEGNYTSSHWCDQQVWGSPASVPRPNSEHYTHLQPRNVAWRRKERRSLGSGGCRQKEVNFLDRELSNVTARSLDLSWRLSSSLGVQLVSVFNDCAMGLLASGCFHWWSHPDAEVHESPCKALAKGRKKRKWEKHAHCAMFAQNEKLSIA